MITPNSSKESELFDAVKAGRTTKVRKLLAAGANSNARNKHDETPIMVAASKGQQELFILLEESGADLSARTESGNTVLWRAGACTHGNEAAARNMFERALKAAGDEEKRNMLDRLLVLACSRDRTHDYVRFLLRVGADPKYVDYEKVTALVHAVWLNRPEVVKELLKAGADPNALLPRGRDLSWTADIPRKLWEKPMLELALAKKLDDIAKLLSDAGATRTAPEPEATVVTAEVHVSWNRIETWLKSNAPGWKPLKRGATAKQLEKAQQALGLELPNDFKVCYRTHNGSEELIPGESCNYFLLALDAVVSESDVMAKLLDGGDFEKLKPICDKGIRNAWWHKAWIPLASNGGGDLYCLDLDPDDGGALGQIIGFKHDSPDRYLLAPSLKSWLFEFANDLESGKLKHEVGSGVAWL